MHILETPAGNPIFSPISQQPTVGNSSTHENGLTRCQSIHWRYLLAVRVLNPSSIAHISGPVAMVSESQDLHQVPSKPLTNPYCNIRNTNTIPSYNTVVRQVSVTPWYYRTSDS